ncbi:uncharacterized protein LOC116175945 [Photinus pyralis]|uniref:uncharacterized protein LOC116175945 n=1 Tax=Photinus pyralis TaxID=7054 RepID=UPI0012670551|nr:uncharacterized protein LOC116175945 [Photinus pyralis]
MKMSSNNPSSSKTEVSTPPKKLPAFKLYFPVKQKIGFSTGNYPNRVSVVSSKFYSKTYPFAYKECDLRKCIDILTSNGPKQKYNVPITENQRYGWYDFGGYDRNLHKQIKFTKNTHQLVKEHLMNYAKIRE